MPPIGSCPGCQRVKAPSASRGVPWPCGYSRKVQTFPNSLKINTVTPFSKLLGSAEMCADLIFTFRMATVTRALKCQVSATEAVLKINIE